MLLDKLSIISWINNNSITTENGKRLDFENHRYLLDIYRDTSPLLCCTKAGQIGFCLDPNTKILTSDLKWITLDEAKVGQSLVSVNEGTKGLRHGRRMKIAVIEQKKEIIEEAFRLTMSDGRTLIATGQHRFLSQLRSSTTTCWRTVNKMVIGDTIRHLVKPWEEGEYEDGWVGGAIDGEASLRRKSGCELTFIQRPGLVLDRMRDYLTSKGFAFRDNVRRKSGFKLEPNPIGELTLSRTDEVMRLVGITRPSRFISRTNWWEDVCIPGTDKSTSWIKIVKIESIGKQRMIDIQTSTKTFIAEGFVSHNSTMAILKTIWLSYNRDMNVGYVLPTSEMVEKFVGSKVNPMIANNPILAKWVKDKDQISQKKVGQGHMFYLGAQTDRSAIMLTLDILVGDEYNKAPQGVLETYESRLQHSDYKWKWIFSNPTLPDFGVDRFYELSDKKKWHITHSCNKTFVMDESCIDYVQEKYICPSCKGEITKEEIRMGDWIATAKGEWSGYWIPLWINPMITAHDIADYKARKPKEYFANFVAGLSYVNPNDALSQKILEKNLSNTVNDQQDRVIIGVDTGHNIHYTMANKQGYFYHGYCPSIAEMPLDKQKGYDPYDELDKRMQEYPKAIIIADQGGDLIGIRKLQAKYRNRVFLCWFVKETRNQVIIRWGENEEYGKVLVDRNRAVQLQVDQLNEGRFVFNGTKDDWQPFFNHCLNIYRVKEIMGQDENDPQYGWRWVWKRKGPDHWFMSMVYTQVGLDRFSQSMAQIVEPEKFMDMPVALGNTFNSLNISDRWNLD